MASFDNKLYCDKCLLKYDKRSHLPKLLPCGHTLCLGCVSDLYKNSSQYYFCSFCGLTKKKAFRSLETNYAIMQLVDAPSQGYSTLQKEHHVLRDSSSQEPVIDKTRIPTDSLSKVLSHPSAVVGTQSSPISEPGNQGLRRSSLRDPYERNPAMDAEFTTKLGNQTSSNVSPDQISGTSTDLSKEHESRNFSLRDLSCKDANSSYDTSRKKSPKDSSEEVGNSYGETYSSRKPPPVPPRPSSHPLKKPQREAVSKTKHDNKKSTKPTAKHVRSSSDSAREIKSVPNEVVVSTHEHPIKEKLRIPVSKTRHGSKKSTEPTVRSSSDSAREMNNDDVDVVSVDYSASSHEQRYYEVNSEELDPYQNNHQSTNKAQEGAMGCGDKDEYHCISTDNTLRKGHLTAKHDNPLYSETDSVSHQEEPDHMTTSEELSKQSFTGARNSKDTSVKPHLATDVSSKQMCPHGSEIEDVGHEQRMNILCETHDREECLNICLTCLKGVCTRCLMNSTKHQEHHVIELQDSMLLLPELIAKHVEEFSDAKLSYFDAQKDVRESFKSWKKDQKSVLQDRVKDFINRTLRWRTNMEAEMDTMHKDMERELEQLDRVADDRENKLLDCVDSLKDVCGVGNDQIKQLANIRKIKRQMKRLKDKVYTQTDQNVTLTEASGNFDLGKFQSAEPQSLAMTYPTSKVLKQHSRSKTTSQSLDFTTKGVTSQVNDLFTGAHSERNDLSLSSELHSTPPVHMSDYISVASTDSTVQRAQVQSAVGSSIHSSEPSVVGSSKHSEVGPSMQSSGHSEVGSSVQSSGHSEVGSSVQSSGHSVGPSVQSSGHSEVGSSVQSSGHSVGPSVQSSEHSVGSSVQSSGHSVGSSVQSSGHYAVFSSMHSQRQASLSSSPHSPTFSAVQSPIGSSSSSSPEIQLQAETTLGSTCHLLHVDISPYNHIISVSSNTAHITKLTYWKNKYELKWKKEIPAQISCVAANSTSTFKIGTEHDIVIRANNQTTLMSEDFQPQTSTPYRGPYGVLLASHSTGLVYASPQLRTGRYTVKIMEQSHPAVAKELCRVACLPLVALYPPHCAVLDNVEGCVYLVELATGELVCSSVLPQYPYLTEVTDMALSSWRLFSLDRRNNLIHVHDIQQHSRLLTSLSCQDFGLREDCVLFERIWCSCVGLMHVLYREKEEYKLRCYQLNKHRIIWPL